MARDGNDDGTGTGMFTKVSTGPKSDAESDLDRAYSAYYNAPEPTCRGWKDQERHKGLLQPHTGRQSARDPLGVSRGSAASCES